MEFHEKPFMRMLLPFCLKLHNHISHSIQFN